MDIAGVAYKDAPPPPPQPVAESDGRRSKRARRTLPATRKAKATQAEKFKRKCRNLQLMTKRMTKRVDKLNAEIGELKEELKLLRIRTGRCVSLREGLDLGLRASMSNQGANSLGTGLKTDLSRWSCVRWEIKLHASLVAYFRSVYKALHEIDYSSCIPSLTIHVVGRHSLTHVIVHCGLSLLS